MFIHHLPKFDKLVENFLLSQSWLLFIPFFNLTIVQCFLFSHVQNISMCHHRMEESDDHNENDDHDHDKDHDDNDNGHDNLWIILMMMTSGCSAEMMIRIMMIMTIIMMMMMTIIIIISGCSAALSPRVPTMPFVLLMSSLFALCTASALFFCTEYYVILYSLHTLHRIHYTGYCCTTLCLHVALNIKTLHIVACIRLLHIHTMDV